MESLLKNVHKRCPFCCACTKHLQYGSYSDQVATVSTNSVAAFSPQNSLENTDMSIWPLDIFGLSSSIVFSNLAGTAGD